MYGQSHLQTVPFTIANGASLSDALYLADAVPVAIVMPAAWTAAALTFKGSYDGSTYYDIYDTGGTELNYTVDASRFVVLDPTKLQGILYLKVRSGTTGAAVNQLAARSLTLVTRPV